MSQAHWDRRYETIGAESVSWFEADPSMSLAMLDALGVVAADSVVDVGGGASVLVDRLVERGHRDVTVLDVSAVALDVARRRVGDAAHFVVHDLLTWQPGRRFDVWHDRAVLHFLLGDDDRAGYVAQMRAVLRSGGAFVVGTFAEDGPTECSALPVRRNSPSELRDLFGDVEVVAERRHVHTTPSGATQPFNWIAGRLR